MKKVLFATSALVLSAGFASAEVAVSGDGRMGVIYDGNDAQFSSRARVKFTLTGESDSGLSFGAAFRVDQENYNSNAYRSAARGTAGAIWISGTYGKLAMGDVVSASEAAIGDLYEVGYTQGGFAYDIEEISYLTGDGANTNQGPNILYSYTMDRFSVYASASDGQDNKWPTTVGAGADDATDASSDDVAYSVAAKYDAGNWWASLGYAKHGDAKEVALGAGATFNQFTVKGVYVDYKDRTLIWLDSSDGNFAPIVGDLDNGYMLDKTFGLSADYAMDAVTIGGFWRRDEYKSDWIDAAGNDYDDQEFDSFGIGAEYDLGGGATLAGGIIDTDYLDDTVADVGVRFTF